MTLQQIESQCDDKAEELLEKHFGNLIQEAAIERPEIIGDYSLDLTKQIESEYYEYLKTLWTEIAPNALPACEEIIYKKYISDLMTDDYRESIPSACYDTITITCRERIDMTNHLSRKLTTCVPTSFHAQRSWRNMTATPQWKH